jgi:hypothetical protein
MALTRIADSDIDFESYLSNNFPNLQPIRELTNVSDILTVDPVLPSNPILSAEDALVFIDALTNGINDADGNHFNIIAIGIFVCYYVDSEGNSEYRVFFDAKRADGTYFKDTGGGSPDPNPFPVH